MIPSFYHELNDHATDAEHQLAVLSTRTQQLTKQIPTIETIRGFFMAGGSKTGCQYRAAMQVVDVVFLDQHVTVRNAVNALVAWYAHIRKTPFMPADYIELEAIRNILWQRLLAFPQDGSWSMNTPKIHCCSKIATTLELFGTCRHTSTDAYERAHKAHKAVYARYVEDWHLNMLLWGLKDNSVFV